MAKSRTHALPAIVAKHQKAILEDWLSKQRESGPLRSGQVDEAELRDQSSRFLDAFRLAVQRGSLDDVGGGEWEATRDVLDEVSRQRATQGFSPSQTATFVFSMK